MTKRFKKEDLKLADVKFDEATNPIKREFAEQIGQIAVSWSRLEDMITYVIQEVLQVTDEVGVVLYGETSSLQKMNMLRGLIYVGENQIILGEYDALHSEFNRLRAIRNDLMHGMWRDAGPVYLVTKISAQDRPRIKPRLVHIDDLSDTLKAINNLFYLFHSYIGRITSKNISETIRKPREAAFQAPNPSQASHDLDQARAQKKARLATTRFGSKKRSQQFDAEPSEKSKNKKAIE